MQLLPYTQAHEAFRQRLKAFCDSEVTPHIEAWEKHHQVPREVWKKMGKAGFLSTSVPREYGGPGLDFLYSVIALEEVSRTNHYGLDAFLHSDIVVPYILSYGTEAQKHKYLPGTVTGDIITAVAMTEPGAGSDLASMETIAVEDANEVVLNGTKIFISNGSLCDLVVVAARDAAEDNPHQAITLYLVEDGTKGFAKGKPFEKLGVRSQDTTELFFTDCRIPKENRLGEKGSGFRKLMEKLQQERLLVAILGLTKAEFVLEWTLQHLAQNPRKVSQAVSFAMAEMATEVALARTFIETLIVDHMAGENVVQKTSMAKYYATHSGNRIANRCLDLVGDLASLEACPIVRTFRDLRVTPIFAGTNEVMKMIIAKSMGI